MSAWARRRDRVVLAALETHRRHDDARSVTLRDLARWGRCSEADALGAVRSLYADRRLLDYAVTTNPRGVLSVRFVLAPPALAVAS